MARRVRRPRPAFYNRMTNTRSNHVARQIFRLLPGLIAVAALLLVASCDSTANADKEESIDFTSAPSHAKLTIDGNPLGTTPTSAVLGKGPETHLVVSKTGFVPQDVYLHTVNGRLTPNPVDVKLRVDVLPDKPGADRAGELARCLQIINQHVADGSLAAEDEAEAEAQVRSFYK